MVLVPSVCTLEGGVDQDYMILIDNHAIQNFYQLHVYVLHNYGESNMSWYLSKYFQDLATNVHLNCKLPHTLHQVSGEGHYHT